jgi:hypothetical protein
MDELLLCSSRYNPPASEAAGKYYNQCTRKHISGFAKKNFFVAIALFKELLRRH